MKTRQAIEHYGSTSALAEALGVTPAAISQWGDYPPDGKQLLIERLSIGALKAESGALDRIIGLGKVGHPPVGAKGA